MPDPYARPRNTAEPNDVLAYQAFKQSGELTINARENSVPTPGDVAAFPQGLGGGPAEECPVGSSTVGALIIHDMDSEAVGFYSDYVFADVVVSGPTGAEVGLLLFVDGQFDIYLELRIVIGGGEAGKVFLRYMHNGYEIWRAPLGDCCKANERDLTAATDISLRLCIHGRGVTSCTGTYVAVGTVTAGANTYQVGQVIDRASFGATKWKAGLCIAAGSGVTFNDFAFEHAGMPNCPYNQTCETCETCNHGDLLTSSITGMTGWTAISGTWATAAGDDCTPPSAELCCVITPIDGDYYKTSDANAIMLHDEHWANDNLYMVVRMCLGDANTGGGPTKARLYFSYVSPTIYWALEVDLFDYDDFGAPIYKIALVKDGVQVWYFPYGGGGHVNGSIEIGVNVYGCKIFVLFGGYVFCAFDDAELNDTGVWGVGTGDVVSDYVGFYWLTVACGFNWDCATGTILDPRDPTDPEPPDGPDPTDCCTYVDMTAGDEYEITISGVTYFTGGSCLTGCPIDSDYLTALNSTFTIPLIYFDTSAIVIHGSTFLLNPCDSDNVDIWIFIVPIDPVTCRVMGFLYVGDCLAKFSMDIFPGDPCTSFTIPWVSGDMHACCLGATGATTLTVLKL